MYFNFTHVNNTLSCAAHVMGDCAAASVPLDSTVLLVMQGADGRLSPVQQFTDERALMTLLREQRIGCVDCHNPTCGFACLEHEITRVRSEAHSRVGVMIACRPHAEVRVFAVLPCTESV